MDFAARVMEISEAAGEAVKTHLRMAKVKEMILKYELPQMLSVSESHLDVSKMFKTIGTGFFITTTFSVQLHSAGYFPSPTA
jgi:hypothetical protein